MGVILPITGPHVSSASGGGGSESLRLHELQNQEVARAWETLGRWVRVADGQWPVRGTLHITGAAGHTHLWGTWQ